MEEEGRGRRDGLFMLSDTCLVLFPKVRIKKVGISSKNIPPLDYLYFNKLAYLIFKKTPLPFKGGIWGTQPICLPKYSSVSCSGF